MEIQIKRTIKAGNSSAVILPRSWLNKSVKVELIDKTPDIILDDVLKILKNHLDIKDITGIYLTGSYARSEQDIESDIDILVISKNTDKEMINTGIYNILIISKSLLEQKLYSDLFPIGPMLIEAKPLINSDYIENIDIKVTKNNISWYLRTTKEKLDLIKKIIKLHKQIKKSHISDSVAYTLILRIRTLHLIEYLKKNRPYSKNKFIKLINNLTGSSNAYERYLVIKNNMPDKSKISLNEIEKLYDYLDNQLIKIKKLI